MNNFNYHNPTRLVFGRGSVPALSRLIPPEARVLLLYGGGSIKRNGVYSQVEEALGGRTFLSFGGIEPNPDHDTCLQAVDLARKEGVDFLLSVGGGSVLDGTKYIAAAIPFEGDPWDILEKGAPVRRAVALGAVLTLPATGSEANGYSVVSRRTTKQKLAFGSPLVYPLFSILDPLTTCSLDQRQTANGIVDAFMHCIEQYMTYPVNAPLQDRQAEAVMLTLIEEGPKALRQPEDYDARANVMWACTCALNGTLGLGVPQDWSTHLIGHELTAFFGIDHARTLAVVGPALLRRQKEGKRQKLIQWSRRVWGITGRDEDTAIESGLQAMEAFFNALGVPTRLRDHGVEVAQALPIADRFAGKKGVGERGDIDADRVREILQASV